MDRNRGLINILSGFALGALIGIVVGLSVSHVVGLILGALTSLLAAFFGLTVSSGQPDQGVLRGNSSVIFSFSISCVICILAGIYIRTHNYLGQSIGEQKNTLVAMGVPENQIPGILLKLRYDISIPGSPSPQSSADEGDANKSALYSTPVKDMELTKDYTYKEIAAKFSSGSIKEQQFYNTLNMYMQDTTKQKDILTLSLKLETGK
jgi:hypothetical protein